jgi:hypothetical protein
MELSVVGGCSLATSSKEAEADTDAVQVADVNKMAEMLGIDGVAVTVLLPIRRGGDLEPDATGRVFSSIRVL